LSEAAGEKHAFGVESWTRHHDYAKDALGLSAVDPDGEGALIISPLAERTTLTGHVRHRWQMVGAHLTTGYRLRRALKRASELTNEQEDRVTSELPHNAEALLDPTRFEVKEALGQAREGEATRALREAAVLVDRARGRMRNTDPDRALTIWKSLVDGRWSMVDWFDSDDRRFVLAIRNPPGITDPHGLTKRESQVATYAALGESGKLIGYRLGISTSRVSTLLKDAMRKLRVHTQAELVLKMQSLGISLS
jgi:DNA-binding CsgD family transcriptional regulator